MEESNLRIVFMGTPEFAVPSLYALAEAGMKPVLCVSQPDKPQGRKREILPTPVHEAADRLGILCIQPIKVKNRAFLKAIADARPDFIVTAAYGRILTSAVLALPRIAPVNVHGSLLPKYRGASPVQAALINGDKETGVSILRMTEAMDAGGVYTQSEFTIPEGMRADELMTGLACLGAEILPQTLLKIAEGDLEAVPQDESQASYVSLLSRESGWVDWQMSAQRIVGLIRGCYPWPAAFASFAGKRVKLLQAFAFREDAVELPEDILNDSAPGTILSTMGKKLWIRCGTGILCLTELQSAGSRAMSSADCAHNFRPGQRFMAGELLHE
ncbi:MAG: methionyl-tRNA formyltransferase [Clostridia bacterium]|nr:methionyl-tRNA formyltransferase [Clostridia bacterium]